jgi:hypothetical protein
LPEPNEDAPRGWGPVGGRAATIGAVACVSYVVLVSTFGVPQHDWGIGLAWIVVHLAMHRATILK